MDRDRTDPYGFGRRDERPRGDGGDGGRDLKRPRRGYDPSAAPPPGRYDAPPPRHYPVPGYAGYQGGFFGGPRGGPPPRLGSRGRAQDGRWSQSGHKMRLLGRLGWTCAAVPYFEWDPLLASGATEPYLRGVLARLAPQN